MILKIWRARLMGCVSDNAMLCRLHGRDPRQFIVMAPPPKPDPGAEQSPH